MTGVDQAEKTVKYDQYWRTDVTYKFIDLTQGKIIDGCRDRYGNVSSVEDNPTASMNHCPCSPYC